MQGQDGNDLPYNDCIWESLDIPFCDTPIWVLALVVPSTKYNLQVSVIVGTHAISCTQTNGQAIPTKWNNAFIRLQ